MTQPPRSLVLITIDCLRADHVGFLGHSGQTTPFLDSLAGESTVFQNAIATGIPTYYSLPALFASRYPLALGRDVVGIAPGESTITTELKDCGFRTAAFVAANPYISATYGYERGFETFHNFLNTGDGELAAEGTRAPVAVRTRANKLISDACHNLPLLGAAYDELYFRYCQKFFSARRESLDSLRQFPSADHVVDCAIAWLNENSGGPFFLWIHLMDPHAPYYPKEKALSELGRRKLSERAQSLNAYWARTDLSVGRLQEKRVDVLGLYDAGIRWADSQIGRLVQKLKELNVWQQCAMAVTADHGEEFLDHGGRFHSPVALHDELIHVPLLLRVPGSSQRQDVTSPIGLIDLAPTLLDVLGLSIPASFRGRSCWQKIKKHESWDWPVLTECVYGCNNPSQPQRREKRRLLAVRKGNYKLIVNFATGNEELFDLASDPREMNPLTNEQTEERRYLLQCASKHLQEISKSRDIDLRLSAQMMDLRLRWTQSASAMVN